MEPEARGKVEWRLRREERLSEEVFRFLKSNLLANRRNSFNMTDFFVFIGETAWRGNVTVSERFKSPFCFEVQLRSSIASEIQGNVCRNSERI